MGSGSSKWVNRHQKNFPQLMLSLNATYLRWALVLLAVELAIGLYLHDAIIRPYGGDFLMVILLYCLLRGLLPLPRGYAAGAALLLAYAVEAGQYFDLLARLGWQHLFWARLLLGSHFTWVDIAAYTAGIAVGLSLEWLGRSGRS